MIVEIYHGLPYNKWEVFGEAGGLKLPPNPFKNFRISKGGFMFQLITNYDDSVEIKITLPYNINITI